jgi:preprotein translocase subunit SecD
MVVILLSCSEKKTENDILSFELRIAKTEPGPNLTKMTLDNSDLIFFVKDSVFLNNQDIKSTEVIDWVTRPKVMVTLSDKGREKFAAFTEENIGKNAAILVNHKLVSAPRINAAIKEGKLIIVGHFSHEDALRISSGIVAHN